MLRWRMLRTDAILDCEFKDAVASLCMHIYLKYRKSEKNGLAIIRANEYHCISMYLEQAERGRKIGLLE